MAGSLACILSYGLLCTPTEVQVVEAPPATPLEPSETGGDEVGSDKPLKGASAVLKSVQTFYDGTNNLSANFKQTYTNAVYGTKKVSNGVLKVHKPGKMVWDYKDAKTADFWVDGSKIWVVESATKQVIQKDVGPFGHRRSRAVSLRRPAVDVGLLGQARGRVPRKALRACQPHGDPAAPQEEEPPL